MKYKKVNLNKGYVLVYDFGDVKVHNYNTNDYISDQVIVLEKNNKVVIIESPAFYDNNKELESYINSLNVKIDGILLSYHMAGGTFLENDNKYATNKAYEYIDMNIIPTSEAYDIEIPEINSIYTHILGSDCHSIITSVGNATEMIETLRGYLDKHYNLILTSHYVPEELDAVNTKISYI